MESTLSKTISKIKRLKSLVNDCKVNKDGDFYTKRRLDTIDLNLGFTLDNLSKIEAEQCDNMQYYYEYCLINGYVTPMKWLEELKHF
jgi:hypothetical protein